MTKPPVAAKTSSIEQYEDGMSDNSDTRRMCSLRPQVGVDAIMYATHGILCAS